MGIRLKVRSSWAQRTTAEVLFEFDQERLLIGRAAGSDVQLPHPAVSGRHASISAQGAGYTLLDEGSTNGTRLNGKAIPPGRPSKLRSGDVIELGGFALGVETHVLLAASTGAERTSALARRLVREALSPEERLAAPALIVVQGPDAGERLELPPPPGRLILGRAQEADLRLVDADASREHAEVEIDLDGALIRDLQSKNGLRVNDQPTRERRLRDGDEIVVGASRLRYEDPAAARLKEEEAAEDLEMRIAPMQLGELSSSYGPAPSEPAPAEGQAEGQAEGGTQPRAESGALSRPARATPTRGGVPGGMADALIYLLAAMVLGLSLLALLFLLGG